MAKFTKSAVRGLPPGVGDSLFPPGKEPPARKMARAHPAAPEMVTGEQPEPTPKKKVKRAIKVSDTAARRIKQLPNFQEVHNRLCAGISCESIARWLQDDLSLATDVGFEGLVRQLYRYRKHIPPQDRKSRKQALLHERVQDQTHRINTLEELAKLYEFQIQRIDKLIEQEDRFPTTIQVLGNEMDRAARLLNQIVSLKERLGLIKKGAPEVITDMNTAVAAGAAGGAMAMLMQKYGDSAPDAMSNIGKKLAAAIHRAGISTPQMPAEATNAPKPDLDPAKQVSEVPAPNFSGNQ
jgi:hypothetical protein